MMRATTSSTPSPSPSLPPSWPGQPSTLGQACPKASQLLCLRCCGIGWIAGCGPPALCNRQASTAACAAPAVAAVHPLAALASSLSQHLAACCAAGQLGTAKAAVKWAADYLAACHTPAAPGKSPQLVGLIGKPGTDVSLACCCARACCTVLPGRAVGQRQQCSLHSRTLPSLLAVAGAPSSTPSPAPDPLHARCGPQLLGAPGGAAPTP
jgi:hypothetical protein